MAKRSERAPRSAAKAQVTNEAATETKQSGATLGFEAKLWLTADKLRNNMDAAEYKHVVLGLIFLKYISDTFDEHHAKLVAGKGDYAGANPEDKDEYKAENVFWVPPAAKAEAVAAVRAMVREGAAGRRFHRADADVEWLATLYDRPDAQAPAGPTKPRRP